MADTGRAPVLTDRLATIQGWRGGLILCAAGAIAALGQAPVSFAWATLAGLALAFVLWSRATGSWDAARIGWLFGLGYFAASLFWIVEPFLVEPERHGWMAPFALIGLAGGMALFWGAAFGLARRFGLAGGWGAALGWAVWLGVAELARSYVLTGFPWALIGHVWVGWAPMHLAAWVGPIGLTFMTALAVAMLVWSMRRGVALAVVSVALVALHGAGVWQGAQPLPQADTRPLVRLVQPNAAQHLKWDPEHAPTFYARQLEYTAAPAERRPDLVIWPETSVPWAIERADGALAQISQAAGGVPVALGIQRTDAERRFYNSMALLDANGAIAQVYDKHHLVPFGEYIPAVQWLAGTPFGWFVERYGFGYSAGPGAQLVNLGALGQALPLICYEAIFPQDVRAAPERPDWLMQITNDAWFGQIAGPYQHLAQARLRAVEQGLPMVRVANTGVSAVIDARGQVLASLPLGRAGYLDAELPLPLPPTLYARMGDAPLAALLAILAALCVWRRKPIDAGERRA